MTASEWKRATIAQMKAVGTYKDAFLPTVDTLADILERRDAVYIEFQAEGATARTEKISDRGARNHGVNPLLTLWNNLNAQALTFWKELGLTPAGLKRIDDQSMKPKKLSPLEDVLKSLDG